MTLPSDLAQVQILAGLSSCALDILAACAVTRAYDDGQIILVEGDPDPPVFFVLEGGVRVYRTNLDGREQTLIHLGPGAAFNMPAAFEERGAAASAVAVGPARLASIPRLDFCRIATQTPEVALAVLRDFSVKLYHLTRLAYDLSLRSVRGRLARFLLERGQAADTAPVRWTHEQIATQIGTVREVVSRTLRAFVREGLVAMERHRIVVLDSEALEIEAES